MAWFCSNSDAKEWDENQLNHFNKTFSEKYTTVDFSLRINLLVKAEILSESGGYYSFLYPYVFYFFLGQYLAKNLDNSEIKNLVTDYCHSLEKKDHASTILFLSHHSSESWLIDEIQKAADGCFEGMLPVTMGDDVSAFCELVESTSKLVIEDLNVESNQLNKRKLEDEFDEVDEERKIEQSEAVEFVHKINCLVKTTEILGQITKNNYGSTKRVKKESYISSVYDGLLRMLRVFFDDIFSDPELFVKELEKAMTEHGKKSKDYVKEHSKKAAFELVGMICTGIIGRAAQCVSSEKLKEDISSVIQEKGTNAYRLIGYATQLLQPGGLPFAELAKYSAELRGNIFAFTVLQSLVAYHLHMFHTSDRDKQRLCRIADITIPSGRALELKGKRNRISAK